MLLSLKESALPAYSPDAVGSGIMGSGEAPSRHLPATRPTHHGFPAGFPSVRLGLKVKSFSGSHTGFVNAKAGARICIIIRGDKPPVPTDLVQFSPGE